MSEEPFILLSLKDDKAKELSKVIANDSSRKILDFLSKVKDATETEISEQIAAPISTVHYNLSHLMKANLIEVDEFHYSKKGKEVNHYKLANKLIIITPKETIGFKKKLRKILPLGIFVVGVSLVLQFFNGASFGSQSLSADMAMGAQKAVVESAEVLADGAAPRVLTVANDVVPSVISQPHISIALWFFIGGMSTILVLLILDYFKSKKQTKK